MAWLQDELLGFTIGNDVITSERLNSLWIKVLIYIFLELLSSGMGEELVVKHCKSYKVEGWETGKVTEVELVSSFLSWGWLGRHILR